MSEQPHRSIGEVLTELQAEFPDVTISKIRFLESQGLLEPERTPSGYRKFYEGDVIRLRWILIQQRDHFLPLKVIKDRLDAGPPPEELELGGRPSPGEPAGAAAGQPGPEAPAGADEAGPGHLGNGAPGLAGGPADGAEDGDGDAAEHGEAPPRRASRHGARPAPAGRGGVRANGTSEALTSPVGGGSPGGDGGEAEADAEERHLTLAELAEAADLDEGILAELERFGLITGQRHDAEVRYDEDALAVARLAARFRHHGVEPRHLRLYRMAVDRELGLFEQVVAPLLRQRGRGEGSRARSTLDELAGLGDEVRRVLLHRAMRDYLGGD